MVVLKSFFTEVQWQYLLAMTADSDNSNTAVAVEQYLRKLVDNDIDVKIDEWDPKNEALAERSMQQPPKQVAIRFVPGVTEADRIWLKSLFAE